MKNNIKRLFIVRKAIQMRVCLLVAIAAILPHTVADAQIFSEVAVYNMQQRNIISFAVDREANVRYYNIEASNDTVNFISVARVKSQGNTVMPREYRRDITGTGYKYYRITGVYMNWQNEHSAIIAVGSEPPVNDTQFKNAPSSQIVITQ